MRARFWEWINGDYVRITIEDGQSLHWRFSERTEEGYGSHWRQWHRIGDTIYREMGTDGQDCDGRYSSFDESSVRLDRLEDWENCDGVRFPDWSEDDHGQRDYSAEAMGY